MDFMSSRDVHLHAQAATETASAASMAAQQQQQQEEIKSLKEALLSQGGPFEPLAPERLRNQRVSVPGFGALPLTTAQQSEMDHRV